MEAISKGLCCVSENMVPSSRVSITFETDFLLLFIIIVKYNNSNDDDDNQDNDNDEWCWWRL